MKMIDIVSRSIEHFTNIPRDFVINHIHEYVENDPNNGSMFQNFMSVEIPQDEAVLLLHQLKGGTLQDTLNFIVSSVQVSKKDTMRQAMLN